MIPRKAYSVGIALFFLMALAACQMPGDQQGADQQGTVDELPNSGVAETGQTVNEEIIESDENLDSIFSDEIGHVKPPSIPN